MTPERVRAALARVAGLSAMPDTDVTFVAVQPRAVVVRTDDKRTAACLSHATRKGYRVAVADATTALAMVATGVADVIVAAATADLPIEIADAGGAQRPPQPTADPGRGLLRRPQLRGPFGDIA